MADINKLQTLIQLRRGFQAQWDAVANTYIPKAGEPCVTLDGKNKGQIKIGDGTSTWGELKYVGVNEGAMHFIGTVATKTELPESAEIGDIYQVTEDSKLYIWDGDSWEIFHAVDLSNYYTKEETTNLVTVEIGKVNTKIENLGTELAKDYALKTDLDVIKVYGDTASDTSMEVNGQKYNTASEAIAAVSDGGTIKLSGGLGADEVINADKKFTLDMNNAVIVDNEKTPVNVNGALTLTGNGSVECNKNGKPAINNNGNLIIENGSYTRSVDEKGNSYYTMVNHGNIVINDGIFQAPRIISSMISNGYWDYAQDYKAGEMAEYPELTVNGGTFINAFYVIKNDDNGKLYINGGNFYGTIFNNGYEMVVKGGNFKVTDGTYNIGMRKLNDVMNSGKLLIEGGTFYSNGEVNFKHNGGGEEPEVVIKGGKFSAVVPEKYIAEGYEQKYIDGYYVVSAKA
uniref:Hyaluronidase n=2 Tax=unclassified Caudoviricetes TaxID=2788787 RepID=A0A8S5PIL1_9CAUD|nr:MAG TPA: hyaluronidase [Siphoviridae sp. ctJcm18]DAE06560.1 MAG TPA: hyaluronidase [Siphoviridae sp. ctUGQ45]